MASRLISPARAEVIRAFIGNSEIHNPPKPTSTAITMVDQHKQKKERQNVIQQRDSKRNSLSSKSQPSSDVRKEATHQDSQGNSTLGTPCSTDEKPKVLISQIIVEFNILRIATMIALTLVYVSVLSLFRANIVCYLLRLGRLSLDRKPGRYCF